MAGFQDKDLYKTPGVYNPPDAVFTVFMELPQNIPKKLGVLIGPNGRILRLLPISRDQSTYGVMVRISKFLQIKWNVYLMQ